MVIVSAGAGMGNNEHKYSTIAILVMLQNIYGLTYEEDVETLATTRSQIDCANDKGVLITIYPGYPTGDTYVPGMSTILQTGKYDTVLACNAAYAKFSVAIDEVEKATGTNIRVSAITAINDSASHHLTFVKGNYCLKAISYYFCGALSSTISLVTVVSIKLQLCRSSTYPSFRRMMISSFA